MYFSLDDSQKLITNSLGLIVTNQNIVKCIKYNSDNALSNPDLSDKEIDDLISSPEIQDRRLHFTPFNLATSDKEKCEIRLFIKQFNPQNNYLSDVAITFQIICHNNLWLLEDGQIRPLTLISELLNTFNGVDVNFIGKMYFDKSPINLYNYNSFFSGYELNGYVRST